MRVGELHDWVRNLERVYHKPFSIWPEAGTDPKSKTFRAWSVESATERGKTYRVMWAKDVYGEEYISCTCPAYVLGGLRCKHAAYALMTIYRRKFNLWLREKGALAPAKRSPRRSPARWSGRKVTA